MHVVHLRQAFAVPITPLFRAWSEPEQLARWAWGSLGNDVRAEVDFKVGGSFRVETVRPGGMKWAFHGVYTAIEPGRRIAHTIEWDAPMGYAPAAETVEVVFLDEGKSSIVEFRHSGVPDERSAKAHEQGWQNTFDALAKQLHLQPRQGPRSASQRGETGGRS